MDIVAATSQLSVLLDSGVPLYDALLIIINEEENRDLRERLINIKDRIGEGSSFTKALETHLNVFPEIYQRMVEAGETSGTLNTVLLRLADYLESKSKIYEKIKTAILYPALMTIVGILVLSFLFLFVIPKITRIFEDTGQTLPLITILLLKAVDLFRNYWVIILIGLLSSSWGFKKLEQFKRFKENKDILILKLPYIGKIVTKFYAANLSRTLGSLLYSGVPMLKALNMTQKVLANHTIFKQVLNKAIKDVTEGRSLSGSLKDATIIPGILTQMIAIGERSGRLENILLKAADTYEKDFERSVNRALAMLEPMLILIMGIVVGFIVLAILLPIFELNQITR